MGLGHSPSVVTSGLVLALDAGNTKSYPGSGTTWTDLSGNNNSGTLINGPTYNSYEARTNVNLYSEQFNNAAYSINQGTISTNQVASPDGTTTAESFTASAGTVNPHAYQLITTTTSSVYTFSIYVKKNTHDFVQIVLNGVANGFANFNISSGVVGILGAGGSATSSIVNAGNGWYRCIITYTTATTSGNGYVNLIGSATSGRNATFSAAGTESVYLWGQQLELGSFATSYIPTTSSPVTRSAGPATLVFDGVNDYVATATATALGLSSVANPFTISSWFKTSGSGEYYLFDNYDNNGLLEDISFRVDGGVMEIYMHASTSGDTGTLRFGSGYNNNAWHNFVMVWNGSNNILGYADGTLIGSTTSYTFSGSFDSGTAFWIGQRPGSPAVWFPGSIAVTHFYNTALTADQVLQNFNALRGRFGL